jgi:gas vesicle protein
MSTGKVLLGVLAGAAAGAALGLLFAPAKGSMTRKRIARKGTDYAEDVKEMFGEYIDVIAEGYNTVKESAVDLADKARG